MKYAGAHKVACRRYLWYNWFGKPEFDEDMIFMKLENAELKHIERIVAISKAAFDSDLHVGASEPDAPPE